MLPDLPPLPSQLTSVVAGAHGRMAVIDGRVYREGDTVPGADAAAPPWRVESIQPDRVWLRFGEVQRALPMTRAAAPGPEDKKTDGKR